MPPLIALWIHRSREPSNSRSNSTEWSKQANYSTRENGLLRVKLHIRSPIWWGHSMQWRPFPPKGGGLIQVDISGHPSIPLAQKQLFQFGSFCMMFQVLIFWVHFEAVDNIFLGSQRPRRWSRDLTLAHSTIILLRETFPTVSWATQMEIICKSYALRNLT